MKKMTVALLRVSTDNQDTELQKGEILNYCKQHNMKIDKWIENTESGKKKKLNNMQGIKEIRKLIQDDLLEKVIVYRQDRISRRTIEVLNFIDELNRKGVEIYATNKGKIETDKIGLVVSFMDAYISEIEVENTRERITSKLKVKNQNNEYAGGNINYGYKYNKETKQLEINEEEAIIVRRIFNDYMVKGTVSIARELREEGIKKRANGGRFIDFSPGAISKIIGNQIYIGYKEYNKVKVILKDGEEKRVSDYNNMKTQDYNPNLQIISNEVFEKVKLLRKERIRGEGFRKLNRSKELLEGLVYHKCSDGKVRKMYIGYDYRNGRNTAFFRCKDCTYYKREGMKSIVSYKVEKAVIEYVKSFMATINKDGVEQHLIKYRGQGLDDLKEQLQIHKSNLERYNKRLKNAKMELVKYLDGESAFEDKEIKELINEAKNGIEISEKQIILLENEISSKEIKTKEIEELLNIYSTFNDVYDKARPDQKKSMLRECIDKIIIQKDEMEVVFKLNIFF